MYPKYEEKNNNIKEEDIINYEYVIYSNGIKGKIQAIDFIINDKVKKANCSYNCKYLFENNIFLCLN